MRRIRLFVIIVLVNSLFSSLFVARASQEYEFDVSEFEKKPYTFGGFFEFEPVLLVLDRDSALYKLRFPAGDQGRLLGRTDLGARLEAAYEKGIFSAFGRAEAFAFHDDRGWDGRLDLLEGYLTLKPTPGFALDAGKKVTKWGTGFFQNVVSFVDRPKDPEDPQEPLEGFYVLKADFIKAFDGALQNVTFTPVVIPVGQDINRSFGRPDHVNFAGKLYLLLWDTDLDLLFFTGDSRTTRYGVDFARNIKSNFEIHGELAWITDVARRSLDAGGEVSVEGVDVLSALAGMRYLTPNQLTIIAEYYHNGQGIEEESFENFLGFVDEAYEGFVATGRDEPLQEAQALRGTFAGANPMRDYLYFRATQKEPFGVLYFTPGITSIINLQDGSFQLTPEVQYSPLTNLALRFRTVFLVGPRGTEYGEKLSDFRLEFRMRFFF